MSLGVVSCQKVAEVRERRGAVASCRGLPKGGGNEKEKGCRKLSRAARKCQGCREFYGVTRGVLDYQKVALALAFRGNASTAPHRALQQHMSWRIMCV